MSSEAQALPRWQRGLPARYAARVVPPWRFDSQVDEDACAHKLSGFDARGRRCFVCHDHTAVIEAFDIDEFPLEVAVSHVRHTAWRLRSGQWLLSVARIERLDSCRPRVSHELRVAAAESLLGI
jgi:hypothetical protein